MGNKVEQINSKVKQLEVVSHGPSLPINEIRQWRSGIFDVVASRLCDSHLPVIQRLIGIWPWSSGINLPKRDHCAILEDGAMRISVKLSPDQDINIIIWLFCGEARIGVRVSESILRKSESLRLSIAESYDGAMCTRVSRSDKDTFFDWIFKDGFADRQLMTESLKDPVVASFIADAISNLVTHFYMATINAIVSSGIMIVSPDNALLSVNDIDHIVLDASDFPENDITQLSPAITNLGIHIDGIYPQNNNRALYLLSFKKDQKGAVVTAMETLVSSLRGRCEFMDSPTETLV